MATTVSIIGESPVIVEGDFFDKITILVDGTIPPGDVVTFDFEIVPGAATPQLDYIYKSTSASFDLETGVYRDSLSVPSGSSITSILIDVLQDSVEEDTEAFSVNITGVSSNAEIGENSSITVTVLDDDRVVNPVNISAVSNGTELSGDGQFVISLGDAIAADTVVNYTVGGTATANSDYVPLAGSVTIPAGSLSAFIDVTVLDDPYLEDLETVEITLTDVVSDDNSVTLGDATLATVTIADDSSVIYRVNAGGAEIAATDDGPNWLADTGFLSDPGSNNTAKFPAVEAGITVAPGTPGEIFDTERFDIISAAGDTEMQYAFDVDPGLYEVRLYMGNGYEGTSLTGERVFDVAIEGQVLSNLDDIDLSARFGHLVGGVLSNEVTVEDGSLNIEFLHDLENGVQNPLINGIEIIQIGDTAPPPTVSIVDESFFSNADGSTTSQTTLITSELIPSGEVVAVSFDILPNSLSQEYVYESSTATLDPDTGIYSDTITIPSGFSIAEIPVTIQGPVQEGEQPFIVRITDVDGANFEIGAAQLPSFRVEAENLSYTTYNLESLTAASGGKALMFGESAPDEVGAVTIDVDSLTGLVPGEYDISIGTFDVLFPGGQPAPTFSITLNESILPLGEIALRPPIISETTPPGAAVERTIATGVQLGTGDSLTITGFENPDEVFWLDYIQFDPTV